MFREMRRQDRNLSDKEAKQLLQDQKYGVLSLIGENGFPYGVPLHYVFCDGRIYFHSTNQGGLKIELIDQKPQVSFTVVETEDGIKSRSVICFGKMFKVEQKKIYVLESIVEKFVPEVAWAHAKAGIPFSLDRINVYELDIQHMSAKWIDKPEGK